MFHKPLANRLNAPPEGSKVNFLFSFLLAVKTYFVGSPKRLLLYRRFSVEPEHFVILAPIIIPLHCRIMLVTCRYACWKLSSLLLCCAALIEEVQDLMA